jgi:hypothetical protein
MSTLERHCQLLLRAYPAAYREVRGEEIIGTLLEATPPSRSWPVLRDVRGLLFGGLGARAARPRQFTTAGNLRVAALAGVAAYLTFSASGDLGGDFRAGVIRSELFTASGPLLAALLPLIPIGLLWLSRRRLVVLVGALPSAAAICYAELWRGHMVRPAVLGLACLAALVALAGYPERPRWRWFWPLGLLAIAPLPLAIAGLFTGLYLLVPLVALALLSIARIVIDARPTIAMAVFLLAIPLSTNFLLIVTGITAAAVWRLRRQSAHPGRPTQA